MLQLNLKNVVGSGHVDCPSKFIPLSFVVNLLNGNTMLFAPKEKTNVNNKLYF